MDAKSLARMLTPSPIWRAAMQLRQRLTMTRGKTCYSAYGEDLLIVSWLRHYGCDLSAVRYVDIGAAHPVYLSNTYLLYLAGARGILAEPDPEQAEVLRNKRPRDIVINAGVAFDDRRRATLFRMTAKVFNTFSREQAEFVVKSSENWEPHARQRIVDEISVPLIPVNELISTHLGTEGPNFVSIDVEGVDLAILQSFDLDLMNPDLKVPAFICIEASSKFEDIFRRLGPAGFEVTARTPDNWLFRRHAEKLA